MRIVLTGGGTGGHFYPLIAVAEALNIQITREGLVGVELYYISDTPYDKDALQKNNLRYKEIRTGKIRTYTSVKNFTDKFLTFFAVIKALFKLFFLYPDVVFGKGGYASFPTVFAARILRIPVVIHESDTIPGRVNRWIAPYADAIAIAFPESAKYFNRPNHTALVGNPIREALKVLPKDTAHQMLQLDPNIPTIVIIGGSQGSERINETIVDILPKLLNQFQVIHQCGEKHHVWMKTRTDGILKESSYPDRYRLYSYLPEEILRNAAAVAKLIIARSGSSIFEFALWGIPSILIPLPIAREDHQKENAYSYARTGACVVVEEANLKPEILYHLIDDSFAHPETLEKMRAGCQTFAHPDAAEKIAALLLSIGKSHG
jgi:UDP-N-acetylglucosamine--N-acetylmuramyl-(pentapeptide) pyrophosphoryl-undecaprenol N-acetylglucosamine transferase